MRVAYEVLPPDRRTGDYLNDLAEAARTVCKTMQTAKQHRHVLVLALRNAGLAWETIHDRTGIPTASVRRWVRPPRDDFRD